MRTAGVSTKNAAFFQLIDNPGSAIVANPQFALDQIAIFAPSLTVLLSQRAASQSYDQQKQ